MIRLNNVNKSYKNNHVLTNINYEFKKGSLYLVKGISGCGKSTLLNLITGLNSDYEGDIFFNDINIKTLNNFEYRKNFAYVLQTSLLIGDISILDNLKLIRNDENKIVELFNQFELMDHLYKYPSQLSNGQRIRISIIRALLMDCDLIVCDEPTSSLDKINAIMVAKLLHSLKQYGKTIIVCTHDEVFEELYDYKIEMSKNDFNSIIRNDETIINIEKINIVKSKYNWIEDYHLLKNKYFNISILKLFKSSIIFILLFLIAGYQSNFNSIVLKDFYDNYPLDIVRIRENNLADIEYEYIIEKQHVQDEKGNVFGISSNIKDTAFMLDEAIEYGNYPTVSNQIIVDDTFIKNEFSSGISEDIIGETIYLKTLDKEFEIVGIMSNDFQTISNFYNFDMDYFREENIGNVFVLSSEMEQYKLADTKDIQVKITDLYYQDNYEQFMLEKNIDSFWQHYLNNELITIQQISLFVNCSILMIMFILYIYLFNSVTLKLFYRKSEIGYFKLMNFSYKRIMNILIASSNFNNLISLVFGYIIYLLISFIIKTIFGLSLFITPIFSCIIIIVLAIYFISLSYFPSKKYTKQSINELLSDYL